MIAQSKPVDRIGLILLCAVLATASWGTYKQFYPFVTLVTLPLFVVACTFPLAFFIRGGRAGLSYFDVFPVILLFGVLASLVWAQSPDHWGLQAFWYGVCTIAYYGVRFYINETSHLKWVAISAAIGGVIGSLLIEQVVNEWGVLDDRRAIEGVNQNFVSYVFAGTIYLLFLLRRIFQIKRWFVIAAFLLSAFLLYSIFQLDTRGAMLSVGAMLAWVIYAKLFGTRLAPIVFWISMLVSLLFTFGLMEPLLTSFESLFSRNTGDLSGRLPTWHYARQLIEGHLFTGVGAGGFQFLNPMEIGAHNVFLVMLLDTGLIGFLVFLAFLITGLWPAIRSGAVPYQRYTLGLFSAFFFPIAVSGHIELSPFTWILFALTFTLLRTRTRTRTRTRPEVARG